MLARAAIEKAMKTWTQNTDEGKNLAEEMFTIVGDDAPQDGADVLAGDLSPLASEDGITTFAQAIFYNGNEQTPAQSGRVQRYQAKFGWDTLNWDPAESVPEWGHHTVLSERECGRGKSSTPMRITPSTAAHRREAQLASQADAVTPAAPPGVAAAHDQSTDMDERRSIGSVFQPAGTH